MDFLKSEVNEIDRSGLIPPFNSGPKSAQEVLVIDFEWRGGFDSTMLRAIAAILLILGTSFRSNYAMNPECGDELRGFAAQPPVKWVGPKIPGERPLIRPLHLRFLRDGLAAITTDISKPPRLSSMMEVFSGKPLGSGLQLENLHLNGAGADLAVSGGRLYIAEQTPSEAIIFLHEGRRVERIFSARERHGFQLKGAYLDPAIKEVLIHSSRAANDDQFELYALGIGRRQPLRSWNPLAQSQFPHEEFDEHFQVSLMFRTERLWLMVSPSYHSPTHPSQLILMNATTGQALNRFSRLAKLTSETMPYSRFQWIDVAIDPTHRFLAALDSTRRIHLWRINEPSPMPQQPELSFSHGVSPCSVFSPIDHSKIALKAGTESLAVLTPGAKTAIYDLRRWTKR